MFQNKLLVVTQTGVSQTVLSPSKLNCIHTETVIKAFNLNSRI